MLKNSPRQYQDRKCKENSVENTYSIIIHLDEWNKIE